MSAVLQGPADSGLKSLKGFFEPQSIAVIGASANPDKIGHQILRNIIDGGYVGRVYPVNPTHASILERPSYPGILNIPETVDLAVICIPYKDVVAAFEDCVRKGVKHVAIITSGFAEIGNTEPEQLIKRMADDNGISVLGPNIFGVFYGPSKLNATFGPKVSIEGNIAFISQSGALGISLMGWAEMEKIGVGSLVSVGNKCDIAERELIEYFNQDPNIDVVLIYMEGVKNARQFLSTNIKKPVVILKVGRSQRGAKAAASHTGSLAGSDRVYEAAFKQLGVMRADSFTEAFGWARSLSLPAPKGDQTLIITNGGGIGVRTTDECEQCGIRLIDDTPWLEQTFRPFMPEFGSAKNPIDLTGQGGAASYRKAVAEALRQDRIDSLIILYCETTVVAPVEIAHAITEEYEASGRLKPVTVAMVGGERTREAVNYLNSQGIPSYTAINECVSALKAVYEWQEISSRPKVCHLPPQPPAEALKIIEQARARGETSLLEHEAREVLRLCGVAVAPSAFARNMDELLEKSKGLFPLAMKICSPDILHKTDVDGVALNIRDEAELLLKYHNMMKRVQQARPDAKILGVNLVQMTRGIECIVGLSEDEQFGPVMMFGLGGVFVEALKDVSFRVVPFGQDQAQRLVEDIKGNNILKNFRGMSADIPSIVHTLMAVQSLAGYVKEVDINPLISSNAGSVAVDARIIL